MKEQDYIPVKKAFLARKLAPSFLVLFVLFVAVLIAATWVNVLLLTILVALLVIAGLFIVNARIAHRKQLYSFRGGAILYRAGSLFSDKETELKYRNITHVRLIKPFIEYRLFGTGHIMIEAAGSAGTEVAMQSIANPDAVYQHIQTIMASKDFSLQYNELLTKEHPAKIAVVLEMLSGLTGGLVALLLLAPGLISLPFALVDALPAVLALITISLIGILLLGGGGFFAYATYQDLMRRTYYIYDDAISYTRGFLTKQEAFIPIENLSDAELTQNFLEKILNIHDVVISCQGSGSEIPFRNLKNGKEVERVIDGLINKVEPVAETKETVAEVASTGTPEASVTSGITFSDTQATYRMNTQRTLITYVLLVPVFIIFPPLLLLPVYRYIIIKSTEFKLTAKGVASHFSFLSTKNVEFTSDKITGVVVKRNILDRWLSTCSVEFWSIGSTSAVKFNHINYEHNLETLMKEKAGIVEDEELETFRPQFSFREFVKANLFSNLAVFTFFLAILVATYWSLWFLVFAGIVLISYVVVLLFLGRRYRRAQLRYGTQTVFYKIGWLYEVAHYVRYQNVKDATITAYPFSREGTITFNIAGEQVQNSNQGTQYKPNSFSVKYVQNSDGNSHIHDHVLDAILYSNPANQAEYQQLKERLLEKRPIVRKSQPSLKNPFLFVVLAHIILLPTIIILPISLFVVGLWVRRISYSIEENYRTFKLSGVLYRAQTSIVFNRLDYIKQGQHFVNKLFSNGNIYLYTTGSRRAELTYSNISDYKQFHKELKTQYER